MTAAVTLYELADMRDVLDQWLEESEGEVTPELEAMLNDHAGKTNEKIERVGLYIREQVATANAIDEEAKRLGARSSARKKAAEGLKQYLKAQMERLGTKKVDGLLCTVALQNNSMPSVTCTLDSAALKAVYDATEPNPLAQFVVEIPATYRIAASAVVEAQKLGETIPEEITVERGCHVRVR